MNSKSSGSTRISCVHLHSADKETLLQRRRKTTLLTTPDRLDVPVSRDKMEPMASSCSRRCRLLLLTVSMINYSISYAFEF
ncbi:hypothetical protein CEXT_405341 [Caerostris extrusa]|uniref:Uncharacterized protein n=1 Tax=Caerostris extrusa TaxID=172846 RepID=A0AAV4S6U2_CAEEX|nr:hypothetical protein CEXT_405341 [Caerostris extrusa]